MEFITIGYQDNLLLKYLKYDWSRKVEHWPYCTLDINTVLFNKKAITFEYRIKKIEISKSKIN